MHALIVGVGGLGCPAAQRLAEAGVSLTLCDFDRVEARNLGRQALFTEQDVGRLKTEVACQRLAGDVRAVPEPFDPTLVTGHDVVLDCTDEPGTRALIHQTCLEAGVPLVWAAVAERTGQLATVVPGRGPCLRCLWPGVAAPAPCDQSTDAATLHRVGQHQAEAALDVLTGDPATGRLLLMEESEDTVIPFTRRPDCSACGDT